MSFDVLRNAGSMLRTSRFGVETAASNLAGADSPGYTRQRLVYGAPMPSSIDIPPGTVRAPLLSGVERMRTGLLDKAYRSRSSDLEGAKALDTLTVDLEDTLAGQGTITEKIDQFDAAVKSVGDHAEDTALRANLLEVGRQVAQEFVSQANRLQALSDESHQQLEDTVGRANQLLQKLSDINRVISAATKGTFSTNAILDERDLLIDELSGYMNVQTALAPEGMVAVYQNGRQLVFNDKAETLELQSDLSLKSSAGDPITPSSGSIRSLQEFAGTTLPGFQAKLDTLAATFRDGVNAVHSLGYDLDGVTGRNFFSGSNAASMAVALSGPRQVSAAVASVTSRAAIGPNFDNTRPLSAAGSTVAPTATGEILVNGTSVTWNDGMSLDDLNSALAPLGVNGRFDPVMKRVILERNVGMAGPPEVDLQQVSGNLLEVLALDGVASTPGGPSDGEAARQMAERITSGGFGALGRDLVMEAGVVRDRVAGDVTRFASAAQNADERRRSEMGVDQDTELLDVTRYQQSFAAAAKLAAVADEMLTTLIRDMAR